MASAFEQPLRIELKASRTLGILVYLSHIGALVSLCISDILPGIKFLTCVLVLLGFWRVRKRVLLKKSPDAPVEILLTGSDQWWLVFADGRRELVNLLPGSFVHPWLLIIFLRAQDTVYRVLVPADGTDDPQSLRRLRVRLIHSISPEFGP